MKKRFISADELLIDSFKLADQIFQSGFKPHFIVGVWRGGAPVGIAVQEYLDYRGLETDHIAIDVMMELNFKSIQSGERIRVLFHDLGHSHVHA